MSCETSLKFSQNSDLTFTSCDREAYDKMSKVQSQMNCSKRNVENHNISDGAHSRYDRIDLTLIIVSLMAHFIT